MVHGLGGKTGGASYVNGIVETNRAGEGKRDGHRRVRARACHHARHGLVHEDCVGCAHRRPAVFEWIPGEAETRLKVLVVLVIDLIDVGANSYERGAVRVEDNEAVVALGRRHVPLVTQAKLERQVRPQLIVVLHEEAERTLGDAASLIAECYAERVRRAIKERGDGRKVEQAGSHPEIIVEKLSVLAAGLEYVSPTEITDSVGNNKGRVAAPGRDICWPTEIEAASGDADLRESDGCCNAIKDAEICWVELALGVWVANMRLKPKRATLTRAALKACVSFSVKI